MKTLLCPICGNEFKEWESIFSNKNSLLLRQCSKNPYHFFFSNEINQNLLEVMTKREKRLRNETSKLFKTTLILSCEVHPIENIKETTRSVVELDRHEQVEGQIEQVIEIMREYLVTILLLSKEAKKSKQQTSNKIKN